VTFVYDACQQKVYLVVVEAATPYYVYTMTLWEYEHWFGFRAAVDLVRG